MTKRFAAALLLASLLALAAAAQTTDNCCYASGQCATADDWNKGWYDYRNGQCGGPADNSAQNGQPDTAPLRDWKTINNCCFIDRDCATKGDYNDGYYAYQAGDCIPTADQLPSTGDPSSPDFPVWRQGGNCCHEYWNCRDEQDWIDGSASFKDNDCGEFKRGEQPGPDYKPPWERGGNCCDTSSWTCDSAGDRLEGHEAFKTGEC